MKRIVVVLAVVGAVLFCAGPFAWQVLTSLRPEHELTRVDLPSALSVENYRSAFEGQPLGRAMWNSFVVAGATTALSLAIGASAAFALAKLEIYAGRILLWVALVTSMFPSVAVVSPLYLFVRVLGLRDQLAGLVISYTTFTLPIALWILTGFFREIPDQIYRAAIIDGCSPFQAFRKVTLPLVMPGAVTTAILVFISAWNEFLFALTLTSSPRARTVPVAISMFTGEHKEPWGQIAAASVIATLPVILVALAFQRRLIAGKVTRAVGR